MVKKIIAGFLIQIFCTGHGLAGDNKVIFKQQNIEFRKKTVKLRPESFSICFTFNPGMVMVINTSEERNVFQRMKKRNADYYNISALNKPFSFPVNSDKELLIGNDASVYLNTDLITTNSYFHKYVRDSSVVNACHEVNYFFNPSEDQSVSFKPGMLYYLVVVYLDNTTKKQVFKKCFKIKFE